MSNQIPYEIWVSESGQEKPLVTFVHPSVLTDEQAKTEAVATLQDVINKINTPGSGTISVKRGYIAPVQLHIRRRLREDELDS